MYKTQERHVRHASSTSLPNISSLPPGFDQSSPFFQKIMSSPNVLKAVTALIQLFQRKNISMDRQPSFSEMMVIAKDAEIQDAMKTLKEAMEQDGVKLDLQELLKSMK